MLISRATNSHPKCFQVNVHLYSFFFTVPPCDQLPLSMWLWPTTDCPFSVWQVEEVGLYHGAYQACPH